MTYKSQSRLGSLFWDEGGRTSEGTLEKPIVKLVMMESRGRKRATVTSRYGETDPDRVIELQYATDVLIQDVNAELENTVSVGTCTSIGAYRIGKLIFDFIKQNNKHVIVNFTTFLSECTKIGINGHCKRIDSADVHRLLVFYKAFTETEVTTFPHLWKLTKNHVLQLEKANRIRRFMVWYKTHYTNNYDDYKKQLKRLLK